MRAVPEPTLPNPCGNLGGGLPLWLGLLLIALPMAPLLYLIVSSR